MGTVTATLSVSWASSAASGNQVLSMQVDSRKDGLNAGKSSFPPGYEIGFLLFASPLVTGIRLDASRGTASSAGTFTIASGDDTGPETLQFVPGQDTATLQHPAAGAVSGSWDGNDLGDWTLDSDGVTVRLAAMPTRPGILVVNYNSTARAYRLTGVPITTLKAVVFATGNTP